MTEKTPKAQQSKAHMSRATKIGLGVVVAILGVFTAFGVAGLFNDSGNHNWGLGLAPQKKDEDIQKVQKAVESVPGDAIIAVSAKNANSSGTPFGHSITVRVLLDSAVVSDTEGIDAVEADIRAAIVEAGVKDSYTLIMGLNVDPGITSGIGSKETPATTADHAGYGTYSRFVEFEVK